jgi:hypothetical protein
VNFFKPQKAKMNGPLFNAAIAFNTYEGLADALLKTEPLASRGGRRVVLLIAEHDLHLIELAVSYCNNPGLVHVGSSAATPPIEEDLQPTEEDYIEPPSKRIRIKPRRRVIQPTKHKRVNHAKLHRSFDFHDVDIHSLPPGEQEDDHLVWFTLDDANKILTECNIANQSIGAILKRSTNVRHYWCKAHANLIVPPYTTSPAAGFISNRVEDPRAKCAFCGQYLGTGSVSMNEKPRDFFDTCQFHTPCAVIVTAMMRIPDLKYANLKCFCQFMFTESRCIMYEQVFTKSIPLLRKMPIDDDDVSTVADE